MKSNPILTLSLSLFLLVWMTPICSQQKESENQRELEQLLKEQKTLRDVEKIYIDNIREEISKEAKEEADQEEELEFERVQRHVNRHLELQEGYKKWQEQEQEDYWNVAILGNSFSTYGKEGFNREILANFLSQIKKLKAKAVFFSGNLVNGLQMKPSDEKPGKKVEKDITGAPIFEEERFGYDKNTFVDHLDLFYSIVDQILPDTPFYPVMGDSESVSAEAVELFKSRFNLDFAQVFDSKQLAYDVPLGNALFAVVSTDYFDPATKQKVEGVILPAQFKWLNTLLQKNVGKLPFSFVIGNDPAFSTGGSFGAYEGLDRNVETRNLFWSILREGKVLVYFAGKEALYDRTFRYGVWQIISGGAGAVPDSTWDEGEIFYHFLLLRIPRVTTKDPIVEVYDKQGQQRDAFKLSRNPFPVYQMQIPKEIYKVNR